MIVVDDVDGPAIKQTPSLQSEQLPATSATPSSSASEHSNRGSRRSFIINCRLDNLLTFASVLFLFGCILLLLMAVVTLRNGEAAADRRDEDGSADQSTLGLGKKKILIIQSHQSFALSHFSFTTNLAHVLVEAGHQVHLLVPLFSEDEKCDAELERKFNVIYFMASTKLQDEKADVWKNFPGPGLNRIKREWQEKQQQKQQPLNDNNVPDGPTVGPPLRRHQLQRISTQIYLEIANDTEFMDRLCAKKFDIGIAEAFMGNEWGLALFRLLGVPRTVFTSAMAPVPEFYYHLGILGRIKEANVPALRGTKFGDHRKAQRLERADEIWQEMMDNVTQHLGNSIETGIAFQMIAEQPHYGIAEFPTLMELFRQADAYLTNTQPEMDFIDSANAIQSAISTTHHNKICYVGGVNALRARQQPTNGTSAIEPEILKRAEQHAGGIVMFGLGTVLNTSKELSDEQVEAIQNAMEQFPAHMFIWTFSKGDPRIAQLNEQKIANIYATGWVNQPALLAHPQTKAFISHCGMNRALEACWNGVPLICTPWMGDQFYNSEALASKGVAVVLDLVNGFGTDQLVEALEQVLADDEKGADDEAEKPRINVDQMRKLGEQLRQKNVIGDILNAVIGTAQNEKNASSKSRKK